MQNCLKEDYTLHFQLEFIYRLISWVAEKLCVCACVKIAFYTPLQRSHTILCKSNILFVLSNIYSMLYKYI